WGVRAWLEQAPHPIEVVAATTDLDGLDPTADVLIIDLRVGGELVLDRIADLAAAGRHVVVFSGHAEAPLVRLAEQAGALAYVCKESREGREHLVEAVLAAAHGKPYTAPSRAGGTPAAPCPHFSEQELRTMRLWLGGLTRAAVARQMGISEHTVKQYLERARRKYAQAGREAPTRIDLYREAQRDGIVGL
ncbi:LuxR C-terminal-related transcriptional regulator, partial [Actinomadura kijaniata]|uniref:LuxR C-terminal-related transcriptional regulator n=1 Tax=Actinomadura kijaniata TaxID=46161 RepID=UPI003F1CFA1E